MERRDAVGAFKPYRRVAEARDAGERTRIAHRAGPDRRIPQNHRCVGRDAYLVASVQRALDDRAVAGDVLGLHVVELQGIAEPRRGLRQRARQLHQLLRGSLAGRRLLVLVNLGEFAVPADFCGELGLV